MIDDNKVILENSNQEMRKYRDKQIEEVSGLVQEKLETAKTESERIIQDARNKAAIEHSKILESAHKYIRDMAIETTKKLINHGDKDMYDEFIEHFSIEDKKNE